MISKIVLATGLVCTIGFGTKAIAGAKLDSQVLISGTTVQGSLGSARGSVDVVQFVGCNAYSFAPTTSGPYVICYARDAAGTQAQCMTDEPNMMDAAKSLKDGGQVGFTFDQSSGDCTSITVYTNSTNAPKSP